MTSHHLHPWPTVILLTTWAPFLQACSHETSPPDGHNQAPLIESPGDQDNREDDAVSLPIVATDADGDHLVYSASGLPAGLSLDAESGVLSGIIAQGAAASSPYTTEVSVDDGSDVAVVHFQWTVRSRPVVVPDAKYVAPDGDDANPGTASEPWATVKHALTQIGPADTLYLRDGTYWETGLSIDLAGTADEPITIAAYPGDHPVIDGGLQAFREPGNDDWELVDATIDLYRSKDTFHLTDVAGKFVDQGQMYSLTRYEQMDDLTSTNEFVSTGPRYVGPGVFYDSSEAKIYIRLQPSSPQSLNGKVFEIPNDPDPRKIEVLLNDETTAVHFTSGSAYVTIDGIDLRAHYHGFRLTDAQHVALTNLSITVNYDAMIVEGDSHDLLVDNVAVLALFPPWVAWTDMKGSDGQYQPVPTIKPAGLSATGTPLVHDMEIRNCLFDGVFDGQSLDGHDIDIHHNTYIVQDDAVQLGTNSYNIEIHHNLILGPGVSHNGRGDSSAAPGTKYIHHNIIDATKPILWGRYDPEGILRPTYSGWHGQVPFPTHNGTGPGNGDPWKIYHNTVIYDGTGRSGGIGYELWQAVNDTGEAHEVYNNIFVDRTDHPVADGQSTVDGLQIYDGNLYFKAPGSSPLFQDITDSNGQSSYDSLAAFLASQTFQESKTYYVPGWDISSIEADPELVDPQQGDYRPMVGSPAATGALDISGLGLPGVNPDIFRGATDPDGTEPIGRPSSP